VTAHHDSPGVPEDHANGEAALAAILQMFRQHPRLMSL
jgi:hypothetical protein